MKKYECSLYQYYKLVEEIPIHTVLKITRDVIFALSIVHKSGHIYNDLKLENVMVTKKQKNSILDEEDEDMRILLIDFGMCSKFQDADGKHLLNEEMESFYGNLVFASLNTLKFNKPSRKDDLISLCYFLLTLLNGGNLPYLMKLDEIQNSNDEKTELTNIELMRKFKRKYSLKDMI